LLSEQSFEAWEIFRKYILRAPNHGFPEYILFEKFYIGLDVWTKLVTKNVAGGGFMDKTFN
ncbi:hypothetical protein HAX54_047018, partial [Datura stramonium]|nr:hypothetical protein [Datura stramonium]